MNTSRCVKGLTAVGIILVLEGGVSALNESTHQLVNRQAARSSELGQRLRRLGFSKDLGEIIEGTSVLVWLEVGGRYEDEGDLLKGSARYLRHFHDPLKSWDSAGVYFIERYESSVRWMQRSDQDAHAKGTGNWGWRNAREFFYKGVTMSPSVQRDRMSAATFRALGQLMHLVVDASVPEHVRHDVHPTETIFRTFGLHGFGNYEYWVSDQHGGPRSAEENGFIRNYLSDPMRPTGSILKEATGDGLAMVPIAHLLDADRYTGQDPNVTLAGPIGLAEFANANFFSEDTTARRMFSPNYPFPDVRRLVRAEIPDATGRVRAYYGKGDGDGLKAFPVAAECVLHRAYVEGGTPIDQPVLCVDEEVWKEVATHMLPRAVGYSAALLDYFFRGQLGATLRVYSESGQLHAEVTIANQTPEEDMEGRFELYYDLPDGTRTLLKAWDLMLGHAASGFETSGPLTISPLPPDTPPTAWTLVFKGRLGAEPGAVAATQVGSRYVGTVASYVPDIQEGAAYSSFYDISAYMPDPPYLGAGHVMTLLAWGWQAGVGADGVWHNAGIRAVTNRWKTSSVYHLDPTSEWRRIVAVGHPSSACGGYDDVYYGYGPYRIYNYFEYAPTSPASGALVAFDPPETLAELYGYEETPPVVKVLHPGLGPGVTTGPIDITGVRMLGVILTSSPADPAVPGIDPQGNPQATVVRQCGVSVQLQFVE